MLCCGGFCGGGEYNRHCRRGFKVNTVHECVVVALLVLIITFAKKKKAIYIQYVGYVGVAMFDLEDGTSANRPTIVYR